MKNIPKLRFRDFNEDYKTVKLSSLGEFRQSKPFSRSVEGEGEYKYIHYGDIHTKYKGVLTDISEIPTINEVGEFDLIKNGDIIFADASEDYKDLGKTITIPNIKGEKIISGLHTHLFRPKSNLNSIYFHYMSKTQKYLKEMTKRGNGISVLGISKKELNDIKFLMPTIDEQERIANFLLKVDEKVSLLEQKLDKLKLYKCQLVRKLLHDYKAKYDIRPLEQYVIKKSKGNTPIYNTEGKNILISNEYLQNKNNVVYVDNEIDIEQKNVLILWDGSNAGMAYTNLSGVCGSTFANLTLKSNLNNNFLVENILNDINMIKSVREGSGIPHVPKDFLTYYKIPVPPLIEQNKFCELTQILNSKIDNINRQIEDFKKYKKGFLQKMFV